MSEQVERAEKEFYRINEVCQVTDTQPYVLRFWESEFPQLSSTRRDGGQRVYRREDVDLVRRIKQLLYEESYTLESARQQLESESSHSRNSRRSASGRSASSAPPPVQPRPAEVAPLPTTPAEDSVPRQRYDDAVDEIDHLRLQLKEADKGRYKAEARVEETQRALERERGRAARALTALEELLRVLS